MKKLFAAAVLSTASLSAMAADKGFFVAADVGAVSYSGANFGGLTSTESFPNPGSIRIGGGFHFNEYLGVEAGYSIIGDSTINSSAGSFTISETLKTRSYQVAAVGTYPINSKFELFGKLGLANTKIDYSITSNFGFAGSVSASKTNAMFGLGGQFNINQHFGIRAQYEDFGKVQFSGTGAPSIGTRVFSVGGVYNF